MGVYLVEKNNFKIIFHDKNNKEIDLDYQLYDSPVASKWFKKIKHLKNIPIDKIESEQENVSDLQKIYNELCLFAGIQPKTFSKIDQALLNEFHKLYEDLHDVLSIKKNNSILYKFHHSIHYNEHGNIPENKKSITIGWGTKEGPLTEIFPCNTFYDQNLIKNNIYLPWTELGKKPLDYWKHNEPNVQNRINQLCKPHVTFRAKFFIPYNDILTEDLQAEFIEWFQQYKNTWLMHHNINRWDQIDEYGAPLLAIALHNENISNLNFVKIV